MDQTNKVWLLGRTDDNANYDETVEAVVVCQESRLSYFKWLLFSSRGAADRDSINAALMEMSDSSIYCSECPLELVKHRELGTAIEGLGETVVTVDFWHG